MNSEPDTYEWPDEAAPEPTPPGLIALLVLYLAPVLLLLLFPAIAWIALLPLTPLRRTGPRMPHIDAAQLPPSTWSRG